MGPIRWLGLIVLLAGAVLQPIGWIYTHWLTAASIVCIFFGVLLLLWGKTREIEEREREAQRQRRAGGRDMPGDVYGDSGQMSGGRSTSWESHSGGDVGGADGGGGGGGD